MNFETARPEYYAGLKVFQRHTNQQAQLKRLVGSFFRHFKSGLNAATPLDEQLGALVTKPLVWKDLGSGDGSFTRHVLDALNEKGFPAPAYEGIEPDDYFIAASRKTLAGVPGARITKGAGFDGSLHTRGPSDVISAFNALYFANDLPALKADLDKTLKPCGLGLFIQNALFTEKAGTAFIGTDYKNYTATIPTEVFFPSIPKQGFNLITSKASIEDIRRDASLTGKEKEDTLTTKKIIDSMGGISTETDAGQKVARTYEQRIADENYGGKGRYVSDNALLVYVHPDAPPALRQVVLTAMRNVRSSLAASPASCTVKPRSSPNPG